MTYPLALSLSTHLPGLGLDAPAFAWNLWWLRHSLLDLRTSPLWTGLICHPQGASLALHTLTPLNGLLVLPVEMAFGSVVAYNAAVLLNLTLAGSVGYALARPVAPPMAALLGGCVLAFAPYTFAHLEAGHLNLVTLWPLALWALVLVRLTGPGAGWRWTLVGGLALAATAAADLQYLSEAVLLASLWTAFQIATGLRYPRDLMAALARLAVALALGLALAAPLLLPALAEARTTPLTPSPEAVARGSADLAAFLTPSSLRGGGYLGATPPASPDRLQMNHPETVVFLGFVPLALAVVGLVAGWRARLLRWWGAVGLVFLLLALGPVLYVAGEHQFRALGARFEVPLPLFGLVHGLPLVGASRLPARHAAVVMIALAPLAAAGAAALLARLSPSLPRLAVGAGVALVALVLLEYSVAPLHLWEARVPAFYHRLAREPGQFAVLDLPPGRSSGLGAAGAWRWSRVYLLYQTVHRHSIPSGFAARLPEATVRGLDHLPGLGYLLDPGRGPRLEDEDAAAVRATWQGLGLRYAVLHRGRYGPEEEAAVDRYLRRVLGLQPVYADADLVAYAEEGA